MKVARGFHDLGTAASGLADGRLNDRRSADRGCVLTVGNYDGVHLGHQHMIRVLKERASELGCASTVLVFEPSSKEFIDPAGAPPRLTRWREKYRALAAHRVGGRVTAGVGGVRFSGGSLWLRERRCVPRVDGRRGRVW